MYELERALIDTGEATPPRKQAAPYTSRCRVLLGSPGLIFYTYTIIIIITFNRGSNILNSRVSKALDFYRNYCTKQSIRSYHNNYHGIIKDWINQTYLMLSRCHNNSY